MIISAVVVGLSLIGVVSFLLWYHDDSDLVAFKKFAKESAVPVTWDEMGRKLATPDRLKLWHSLTTLVGDRKLRSLQKDPFPGVEYKFFGQVSLDVRAHHTAFDPEKIARLNSLIDQLGAEVLVVRESASFRGPFPELQQHRQMIALLRERVRVASDYSAPEECRRLLDFLMLFDTPNLLTFIVWVNESRSTLVVVSERMTALKQEVAQISVMIDRLAEQAIGLRFLDALKGELLQLLELVEYPPTRAELEGFGSILDASWDNRLESWMFRPGRRHMLESMVKFMLVVRTEKNPRMALARARSFTMAPYNDGWSLSTRLERFLLPPMSICLVIAHRLNLHGCLVAAEMRGEPWPIDSFDPNLKPLRPCMRDDKVMGAYTLGENGSDDGRISGRDYFPLYGPREAPKPSP